MDASVALSKIHTAVERLLKDEPKWSGTMKIKIKFRQGTVVELKKAAVAHRI